MVRKLTGLAVAVLVSSCATVKPEIKTVEVPSETVNVRSQEVAEEMVKSQPLLLKADDLGAVPDRSLVVSFSGGTLRDFCNYLTQNGYPCRADREIESRRILPIYGKVSLKKLLERVGEDTDTYGSWEDGVIRFRLTKTVVYQIPLLSGGSKEVLFKTSNDNLLSGIKDSVFKEIEEKLSKLLSFYSLSATDRERISYREEVSKNKEEEKKKQKGSSKEAENKVEREKNTISQTSESSSLSRSSSTKKKAEEEKQVKIGDKKGLSRKEEKKSSAVFPYSKTYRGKKEEQSVATARNGSNSTNSLDSRKDSRVDAYKKQIAELLSNSLKKGIKYLSTTEGEALVERVLKQNTPLAVSKTRGIVVAVVNRQQEKLLDAYFNQLKKQLESMVAIRVYVVELSSKDARKLSATLNLLKRAYRHQFTADVGVDSAQIEFTNLSTDYLSGIAHGIDASFIVGYLKDKLNAKVVSSVELLSLSRELARLKNAVGYPYLEPQSISVGGTNPTLSYSIKYVYDGFELKMIPTVVSDKVFLEVGFEQSQYLGDKIIQAGNLGTIQVPIQAPKVVNTSFVCRSGDVVFVGGLKKYVRKKVSSSNLGLPTSDENLKDYKEVVVLIEPKIVRFISQIKKTPYNK